MATIVDRVIREGATSVAQLFKFFGVKKRDGLYKLGDLVLANTINPKSKHKPMVYNSDTIIEDNYGRVFSKMTMLSDDMRREGNYGHNMIVYPNAVEAIHGVVDGSNFEYVKPNSWSRLPDFWGYDDKTQYWHEVEMPIKKVNTNSSVMVTVSNLESMFTLGTVKEKGLNLMTANFGFLMWNSAFSADQGQVYYLNLTDVRDATKQLVEIKDNLSVSTANVGVGTWRMYPCITNVSTLAQHSMTMMRGDGDYEGDWIPLPYCNTYIMDVVATGGDDVIIGNISLDKKVETDLQIIDAASLTYQMSSCAISFTNTADTAYTISFTASIVDAYGTVGEFDFSGTDEVVSAGESVSLTWEAKEPYRFSIIENPVKLKVVYWMQTQSEPQAITQYLELTN